jgi:hypothetical protein
MPPRKGNFLPKLLPVSPSQGTGTTDFCQNDPFAKLSQQSHEMVAADERK